MKFKDDSIDARGIRTELLLALVIADGVYQLAGEAELTITSLTDGVHSTTSLHYSGSAVDIRNPVAMASAEMVTELNRRLFDDYDVLDETDHIHIEYQPRNGR